MKKSELTTLLTMLLLSAAWLPMRAADSDWFTLGTGKYTDDLIASMVAGLERQTIDVEVQCNVNDHNLYRVVDPYKNWVLPDDRFKYDPDAKASIVFHVVNKKYAYIEDFATGINYTDTEGSGQITAVVAVSSAVNTFGVDYVFERMPKAFASFRFGEVRLSRMYELAGVEDDNMVAKWAGSTWYANKKGAFCIVLPESQNEQESEWTPLGNGIYTDDIIASYNGLVEVSTFDVEVERNIADPTLYRVVNPYKNWKGSTSTITYDTHGTYYMPFHVLDDGTAWIDDFDTGVRCYDSNIKVKSAATELIATFGIDYVKRSIPGALARYDATQRRLTLPYTYYWQGTRYCLDLECDYGYWEGTNESGAFALVVPDGSDVPSRPLPEETWTLLGNGKFTSSMLSPWDSAAGCQTLDVAIEQSDLVRWHYRMVNPFARLNTSALTGMSVDTSTDHFIEFCAYADHGDGYVAGGSTGVAFEGSVLKVGSATADAVEASGIDSQRTLGLPGTFDTSTMTLAVKGDIYTIDAKGARRESNADNSFTVTIPQEEEEDDPYAQPEPEPGNWHSIGKGRLTDDVIASVFPDTDPQTFDVEIEEDADIAGRYRIVNPYANWANPHPAMIKTDPDNEGLIEFRIVGQDVYFLFYNTGLIYDEIPLIAEQQAGTSILYGATYEEVKAECADVFARYWDGIITQDAEFDYDDDTVPTWLMWYDRRYFNCNTHGKLRIEMPGATYDPDKPDPRVEWWPIGYGSMTDDFMPDILPEHAVSTTFPVEIQRNNWAEGVYRLVDPYRWWPGCDGVSLTHKADCYMVIHTEHAPYVWIEDFYLGLKNGATDYYAHSQLNEWVAAGSKIEKLVVSNPDVFGRIDDGIVTYDSGFNYEGSFYWSWMAGNGPDAAHFFPVNKGGRMTIDLNARPDNPLSVETVDDAGTQPDAQYYDLHGRRVDNPSQHGVYLKRQGSQTTKIVL